jgi:hypothetical protein
VNELTPAAPSLLGWVDGWLECAVCGSGGVGEEVVVERRNE